MDVRVTTPGGTSNPLQFYYVPAPFKAGLSTTNGPTAGGNTVTVFGSGLSTATAVNFGANAATPTVVNDGQLTVTVPAAAAAGVVSVSVTTAGGVNDGVYYTYVDAPTVTALAPATGPESGGTPVTITGTSLGTTESVTFGGATAAHRPLRHRRRGDSAGTGVVDVVLTGTGGTVTLAGAFTYLTVPGI
ncbi:IPT/TIG domain-containing protein [Streptomyces sp. 6N223]|uniref:IPT/TIG domain-containing protein n=1 Tax=Streptomyces sp. 6N223 TaxID=3457412 RepID=UPI003FD44338